MPLVFALKILHWSLAFQWLCFLSRLALPFVLAYKLRLRKNVILHRGEQLVFLCARLNCEVAIQRVELKDITMVTVACWRASSTITYIGKAVRRGKEPLQVTLKRVAERRRLG